MAVLPLFAFAGVQKIVAPIKIDGRFDESCWQTAEWNGNFQVSAVKGAIRPQGRKPSVDTKFAMVADERNLYIGIKAEHDAMDEVKSHKNPAPWASEACELFLMPSGGEFEYYQFLLNYHGNMWAMFYSERGSIKPDPFGPDWERAIVDTDNGWAAEIRIPLSSFYMTRNGTWTDKWRVNVSRTYKRRNNGLGEPSCWADVNALYAEIESFRDYGPFPMRCAEDDVYIRSAIADAKGVKAGKTTGDLKISVYVEKGGDFVFESPYSEPKTVTLKSGDNDFEVAAVFPENGRYVIQLELKRAADGAVYKREFPVRVDYQPVRVKLTTPYYRDNFYPGQQADLVEGTVAVVAEAPIQLQLEAPGVKTQTITLSRPGKFTFDTTGFEYGTAMLTVTCGKDKLVKKIRRLPPLPEGQHASWVENGNLIVDGKAVARRNMYADGFMGGKAFEEKYRADDALCITREMAGICVEPMRMNRDLAWSEAMKDVMPSRKMLDCIDKVIASVPRRKGVYYYIADEPECIGISPVYLHNLYEYIAEKDPYHVISCCCRSGENYIGIADWFETHPYLNAHNKADGTRGYVTEFNRLGSFVDAYHPENHPEKCIGGAPTCFAYPQGDYPTFKEYLLNYWCEFVRGAKTMYPYAYHDMGDRPQMYEGTRYMFESMKALEPLILFGRRETLVKTREYECAKWTMPAGDRAFAFVNFTPEPQKITVNGLWGNYREFRGERRFAGAEVDGSVEFSLEPHESLIACEKTYDKGLKTLAQAAADIDRLEYERTHRDNQLAGRRLTLEVVTSTGRKGAWRDDVIKVVDGVYDVIAWCDPQGKAPFFELGLKDKPTSFREIRIWSRYLDTVTIKIQNGGEWREIKPASVKTEGDLRTFKFAETMSPDRLRFEYMRNYSNPPAEIYEIELPK